MRKNTTLRAYTVFDRSERNECSELVFALTAHEARRMAHLDDVAFIDHSARRSPAFDEFAARGVYPTLAEMIDRGWWRECGGCYMPVTENTEFRVVTTSEAYCNESCHARGIGSDAGYEFARREVKYAEAEALRRNPSAEVTASNWNQAAFGKAPVDGFYIWVRLYFEEVDNWATWDGRLVFDDERKTAS